MKSSVFVKAYCAIENNNLILLTQDAEGLPGWKFPGGHVEDKELLVEGIKREIREEVSLEIDADGVFLIEDFFHAKRTDEHHMRFFFRAQKIGGSEKMREGEVGVAKWFSADELMKLSESGIYPPHRNALKMYLNNKICPQDLILDSQEKISR